MDEDTSPSRQTRQKSKTPLIASVVVVLVVIIVAVILLLTHNTSKKHGLTSAQTSAAKQQIEKNWQTFFNASTSMSDRADVLQDGNKFLDPIKSEFNALSGQSSKAVIKSISLNNATTATVNYTVDLNNQPVLTNQTGKAVLQDNKWVVSDATLCGLLGMAGSKPTVCQGVK